MDAIAAKIINALTSPIVEELGVIWNFKDDLENTKSIVSAIKSVLGDAEGKAINLQVRDWLQKVKDVFLDADDLLDDFSTLALRRQPQKPKLAKEVRIFFSESNQIVHRLKMGHQLKRIMKRLEDIAKVKNELKFIESSPLEAQLLYREREQTHSFVPQHEIIGREEEKRHIINYLLNTEGCLSVLGSHQVGSGEGQMYATLPLQAEMQGRLSPLGSHQVGYAEGQLYAALPVTSSKSHDNNFIIAPRLTLSSTTNVKENVSIVSIVGIGGLGKTTLAQLVYNDKVVQDYFEPRTWICVSEKFNIKQIVQKILGQPNNREIMEQLQQDLRNKIEGKRFLLVLDDMWNDDRELWFKLKNLFMGGRRGSMIIVTTRSEKVSRIMDSNLCISLQGLDEEKSWQLFSWAAFTTKKEEEEEEEEEEPNGGPVHKTPTRCGLGRARCTQPYPCIQRGCFQEEEETNTELIHIGKDIVKKCAGVPLAIRTVGSLLYSRNLGERDWLYFRDSKLSKIDEEENKIFAILGLSYDHLPSHLKNCFAYCSLFPKDFEIEKETLIQLWIAQGFIQTTPDQTRTLEDVGHEYFMNLLSKSFFQSAKLDDYGDIKAFKMHDLIHDLAQVVCGSEYIIISEEKEEDIGDRVRHLSFEFKHSFHWKVPNPVRNLEKLRTILSPKDNTNEGGYDLRLYEYIGDPTTTSFPKCLRVLDLFSLQIREIPKSIGKLKHLRYLDLSYNISIEKLPKSITKLRNLQTLKLNYCGMLRELPRDMKNMVSLRHLELDGCFSLVSMLPGLGQLTCLQTLTQFVLNDRRKMSDSAKISVLGVLSNLRGKLLIKGLKHERVNPAEVESTKLHEKPYLRELELVWSDKGEHSKSFSWGRLHGSGDTAKAFCLGTDEMGRIGEKDEMILEALRPHHTIKRLYISEFCGKKLPEWTGNLSSLLKLEINSCPFLTSLPKSIGNLASLKKLKIILCYDLTMLPDSIGNLLSLQELNIELCNGLVSLPESLGKLKSLWELQIISCHGLTSLPEGFCNLTCLKTLKIFDCPMLCERLKREEGEDRLKIAHIQHVYIY